MHAWMHRIPGGLGIANVFACALFAAMAGSSPATCSAIGSAGIPEMRKRGFDMGDLAPGDIEAMESMEHADPNCIIDVRTQAERKTRALEAHKTQMDTFGPCAHMPDDLRELVSSREYFYRVQPPVPAGAVLDDLFAGIERS